MDPRTHAPAKPSTNHELRSSSAYVTSIAVTANNPKSVSPFIAMEGGPEGPPLRPTSASTFGKGVEADLQVGLTPRRLRSQAMIAGSSDTAMTTMTTRSIRLSMSGIMLPSR